LRWCEHAIGLAAGSIQHTVRYTELASDTVQGFLAGQIMTLGKWLLPFRGRNASGAFDDQNFLWRDGTVYVDKRYVSFYNPEYRKRGHAARPRPG